MSFKPFLAKLIKHIIVLNSVYRQIFGPVQSILKFEKFEEVIDRANDSNYGLGAGVITNDITTAMAFLRHIRAGSVW